MCMGNPEPIKVKVPFSRSQKALGKLLFDPSLLIPAPSIVPRISIPVKDSLFTVIAICQYNFQCDIFSYRPKNVLQIFFLILPHQFRWKESQATSDRCQGTGQPVHLPAGNPPPIQVKQRNSVQSQGLGQMEDEGVGHGLREMPQRGKWSGNQLSPSHTLLLEKGLVFVQQTLPSGAQGLTLSWLFLTIHTHYFRKTHTHTHTSTFSVKVNSSHLGFSLSL